MNEKTDPDLEGLLEFLKQTRGFDFTGYKRNTVARRIAQRLQTLKIEGYRDYQDYLEVHPDEFSQLFNTLLINVTAFFRDPPAWDYLAREILPRIIANNPGEEPIRVWSSGCASGEEPYTLIMALAEALGPEQLRHRVKVYATDLDEEELTRARQASYSAQEVEAVPPELRGKYFEEINGRYVFQTDLRRSIIFGRHDLTQDAPISRLDLITCRNTLMYFNTETQNKVRGRLHFAIKDTGFLFLGRAEMLVTHANVFAPVDLKHRIFRKIPARDLRVRPGAQTQAQGEPADNPAALQQMRTLALAFESGPLAQMVVDPDGHLALASARACALFGVTPSDLGRPFRDLEISYRPVELRSQIEKARVERSPVLLRDAEYPTPDGGVRYLDVQIAPLLSSDKSLMGVNLIFSDVTVAHHLQEEVQRANQELETTNEELQSANEELETTNEELQSTNEELETTNEEMETLNRELSSRSGELNALNTYLESILASLDVGVVVLNRDLMVRVWNLKAEDLWGLRADEVQGQAFLNLDLGLPVVQVKPLLLACLNKDTSRHSLILDAVNRRGKPIQCRVTCAPLVDKQEETLGAILLMEEWGG